MSRNKGQKALIPDFLKLTIKESINVISSCRGGGGGGGGGGMIWPVSVTFVNNLIIFVSREAIILSIPLPQMLITTQL